MTLSSKAQELIDDHKAQKQIEDDIALSLSPPPKVYVDFPQYTAAAMVELMVQNPTFTHKQFAEHFGYPTSWFSGVLVSPNLQAALDLRRPSHNSCRIFACCRVPALVPTSDPFHNAG